VLFDYTFANYEIPFAPFAMKVRAATNFEAIVDTMFASNAFSEGFCPYGAALWPAAVALGHALCQKPEIVRGKKVLELGAGVGLGSIVARKLGAEVTASDMHPDMAELCRHNAELNGVQVPYISFDWNDEGYTERYDTIIGSDLLYDPKLTPLVLAVTQRLLKPGGVALFSDPQRGQLMRLREGFKAAGIAWTETTQLASFAGQSAHCILFWVTPTQLKSAV
jgi:predicted nicotinamide N-methyase